MAHSRSTAAGVLVVIQGQVGEQAGQGVQHLQIGDDPGHGVGIGFEAEIAGRLGGVGLQLLVGHDGAPAKGCSASQWLAMSMRRATHTWS